MVFITRLISITNFCVATSALGFQVFVLYPWHIELDENFEKLKKEHLRVLDAINKLSSPGQQLTASEVSAPAPRKKGILEMISWR
ncbi:putative mitochondrial phosphate carrier protein [Podospora fimiseda]|uniref:Mitochondrial phosphate carrier protein n=1 Tax=Podospora fimiseda TaxID=252190 RepID=A0AAN6YNW2_9PEZI|nr:putative mitochondrial phosphate carrier protein [Podospora fimiseda]